LDGFMTTMEELASQGEARLVRFDEALEELPSRGPAYLPTASYREMEEWALPVAAGIRLTELSKEWGEGHLAGTHAPLLRGSHWKNFFVKYREANRMHKKMMALSSLCRERGNPEAPRRSIGRAQCNDAYWHGVFGGLYLKHLRDAVWANLAEAEGLLRSGEDLGWQEIDLDLDGQAEIWVHSSRFSALVSPDRGGAVEELTLFRSRVNLANTLTRRREAYHLAGTPDEASPHPAGPQTDRGTPSIHELETSLRFAELPPMDLDDRALLAERILPARMDLETHRTGRGDPLHSWAQSRLKLDGIEIREGPADDGFIRISLSDHGTGSLRKEISFRNDGTMEARYLWDPEAFPSDAHFSTELSLGAGARIDTETPEDDLPGPDLWRFPISTYSKSERGFDEMIQGESVTVRWPVGRGEAWIRLTGD
jgi:alpha-amylase